MKLFRKNKKPAGAQKLYGPPPAIHKYRPEDDVPEDIYGPPEMFGLPPVEDEPDEDITVNDGEKR